MAKEQCKKCEICDKESYKVLKSEWGNESFCKYHYYKTKKEYTIV